MSDRWIALTTRVAYTPTGQQRIFDAWDTPDLIGDPYELWESELTPEELAAFDS